MKPIETGNCSVYSERGEIIDLKYFLVIEELMGEGQFAFESYGVRVEQEHRGERTSAQCNHVTCSMGKIDRLLKAITRGGVTPVTLADIVEDWE